MAEVDFKENIKYSEIGTRVRAILGVPDLILTDEIINSPDIKLKASKYINKSIKEFEQEDIEDYIDLLNVAYVYYISYLLCVGMDARLPKQMENANTKTIMQSINWDEKALEMLAKCNEIMDDILSELDDSFQYGNTFAVLSNESEYPNTNI